MLTQIELAKAEALVKTLNLSKNKKVLISEYLHKIKNIDLQKQKKEAEALTAHKLLLEINQFGNISPSTARGSQRDSTNLVLDTSFIKDLIKEDAVAYLVKKALEAEVTAKSLEIDKQALKAQISYLTNNDNGLHNEPSQEITTVNTVLEHVHNKIKELSQHANGLNEEYLKQLVGKALQTVKDPETYSTREQNVAKFLFLAGIGGFIFSLFLVFIIEYIKAIRCRPDNNLHE